MSPTFYHHWCDTGTVIPRNLEKVTVVGSNRPPLVRGTNTKSVTSLVRNEGHCHRVRSEYGVEVPLIGHEKNTESKF